MELKIGDTVELKSGGPVMTVKKILDGENSSSELESQDKVECVWFDNEHKLPIYHEFLMATLVLYTMED